MVNAQSKSDKMYEHFQRKRELITFSFSKNMIDAVNIDLGENEDEKKVTGDLHQVRFMAVQSGKRRFNWSLNFAKRQLICFLQRYKKYD